MVEYNSQALSATFHALSDPTRREILAQLWEGEKCVTDIAAPMEMSLNSVSKHIKKLEACGLVRRRKAGREHFLIAVPDHLDTAAQWCLSQRQYWNKSLDKLETLLNDGGHNE